MKQSLLLKVCGMREIINVTEVASLKPGFMGFIFFKESPRYVGIDFNIPIDFPPSVKRVGVFVNESTETIFEQYAKHRLDYVQLHGNESLDQVVELKYRRCGIIKVFSIDSDFDFSLTSHFENNVDYFLFDTKGKHYGGNAQRFNWQLLNQYSGKTPFFLSGGIAFENLEEIKNMNHPQLAGIDVNSGVEKCPGVKEASKIESIIENLNP